MYKVWLRAWKMSKLYLLSISFILLNPGFINAAEELETDIFSSMIQEMPNEETAKAELAPPAERKERPKISLQPSAVPQGQTENVKPAHPPGPEKPPQTPAGGAKPAHPPGAAKPPQAPAGGTKPAHPPGAAKPPQAPAGGTKPAHPSGPAKPPQTPAGGAKPANPNTPSSPNRPSQLPQQKQPSPPQRPPQTYPSNKTPPAKQAPNTQPKKVQLQRQLTQDIPKAHAISKEIALNDQSSKQMQSQNQMPSNTQRDCECIIYNTAVRPMGKEGAGLWVSADALLWQAVEENLTYIMSGNDISSVTNRELHTVDFSWDWGFRVGAGYNTACDGCDIGLYWTHIRNTAHAHKHRDAPDNLLYQVWTDSTHHLTAALISEAKAHWQANLEQVDLDLGRQFYVGRHLNLRPFIGMRSTWIYQEYDVELEGSTGKNTADMTNRFWGYGFAAGLDTQWKLGCGFSFYGGADISLLLGFFDVDQKGTQNHSKIWSNDKSFHAGRAILDLDLGLQWSHLFCNNAGALTFKVGYEYHLYFNQNQFLLSMRNDDFALLNPASGDLIYQGLIGTFQVDF